MLFAAGMGIGLMFYAVGEPMTHFMAPPTAQPRSVAAIREAMGLLPVCRFLRPGALQLRNRQAQDLAR
jgi:hypothetical protein